MDSTPIHINLLQIDLIGGTGSSSIQAYFVKAYDIGKVLQDYQTAYGDCLSEPLNEQLQVCVQVEVQDINFHHLAQKKASLNDYKHRKINMEDYRIY